MNLILSVYAYAAYKEFYLPVLNDADYSLVLHAGEFGLSDDLKLQMESVGGEWRFQKGKGYTVFCRDLPYNDQPLRKGDQISIHTRNGETLLILIWESATELSAFKKYRVCKNRVSIGKGAENDICYPGMRLISTSHAELIQRSDGVYLRDLSKNGTYLGGKRINGEAKLHFGDMINLFGLTILFLDSILAVNGLGMDPSVRPDSMILLESLPDGAPPKQGKGEAPKTEEESTIHIAPRNFPQIHTEEETIDGVPSKTEGDGRPAWMSILPSMTMVLPMVAGFLLMNGGLGFGLVISIGSAIVGTTWGIINYRFAVKDRQKKERKRQERYEAYLVECTDRIREKFEHNREVLQYLYPDAETRAASVRSQSGLWERKRQHDDFLCVRVGLGDMPFQVHISVPRRAFSLTDDELSDRPQRIAESYSTMREVPINVDLRNNSVVGILTGGNRLSALELTRVLVTQITTNHCYTDVKIAALYHGGRDTAEQWEYLRWLPHVWNEEKSMRYVACDSSGQDEVLYALTQMLRGRAESLESNTLSRKPVFSPHYIFFVEDASFLESQMISKYLFENGADLGITTVILADSYEQLPSSCEYVIENSDRFRGVYGTKADNENEARTEVRFDRMDMALVDSMAREMSALRVNQLESGSDIPSSLTFFEMQEIQKPEDLPVLDYWRKNRTYESMRAALGQKMGGQICYLDINEKHHGPHGLVAGTTGSGKSETLQTYILSLAINFSPQDVGFFIIDFKGGGMANLFSNLPHMIGQISNLSGNQVRRAMVSIKSENLRRQRIFGEFGVNHIDAYTKLVKNREATVPIPHLLIIIDEFAELKREHPEFMRELISVAQVGRSLGVHLILSTQKPSGTVDDNIWSNTKFKLCLRVADKQDSNDMLHKPDAAYLTQAGRGYLQVGNDEIYELFQSGWSGATYDSGGQSVRSSAALLDLQGRNTVAANRNKSKRVREQAKAWIARIISTADQAAGQLGFRKGLEGLSQEERLNLARRTVSLLNAEETVYAENATNIRRIEELIEQLPAEHADSSKAAEQVIELYQNQGKKLPEWLERTQLDVVVRYLAEVAKKSGLVNKQMLWMPLLPETLTLEELNGFSETAWRAGQWNSHKGEFSLEAYIGLADDPEHQQQFPVTLDLADKGHLMVIGSVSSGKSTLLQTLLFSMISTYSPAELNVYAIDYSSQMLCAFEQDAHVGGIVVEGEDEKLDKLFVMIFNMLAERKSKIRGGSFGQYVRLTEDPLPAVVLAIDGYANFNEKTEGRYEAQLLELSRTAEGYGIYLVISCGGVGNGELQTKIAGNMRQAICLELGDKFQYADVLHTTHFDVLPEENVKGRGLAMIDGSILEYQAAIACRADNDYQRGEQIARRCAEMSAGWTGEPALQIPTIPEKPVWEEYAALPTYRAAIKTGRLLPAGYMKETAELYCVDLSANFRYMILGAERSGKSVFLQNLMCSAAALNGERYLVDLDNTDGPSAAATGTELITDQDGLLKLMRRLLTATNERGALRKELRAEGLDDEEIYASVAEKFPPIFVFFANFKTFLDAAYKRIEGVGQIGTSIDRIFEKGRSLNVFFFAAANVSSVAQMYDKQAYLNYVKGCSGVLLGTELARQNLFQFQNVKYNEQNKRYKTGTCYASNQQDTQNMDLIVFPNNRRSKAK
jgi:S-DNA-T family DNA segregation ATPase FtsK/SpoIIIE